MTFISLSRSMNNLFQEWRGNLLGVTGRQGHVHKLLEPRRLLDRMGGEEIVEPQAKG